MKTLIVALLACITIAQAQKQTIDSAEYFVGKDPEEGKGNPLNIQKGDATVRIDWKTSGLPLIGSHDLVYVRVKSSGFVDINGNPVNGKWSLPVAIKLTTSNFVGGAFYSTATLMSAEVKIIRPGLGYPLKKIAFPIDGAFDQVVEQLRVKLPVDSLQAGDTLMIRLQGKDEIWGDWKQMAVRRENMQLPKPFNLSVTNKSQSSPNVELNWQYNHDAVSTFSIERRKQGGQWSEIGTTAATQMTYIDQTGINVGENYCWRVRAVGVKSVMSSDYSNEACLLITGAEELPIVETVKLHQNYPNPFSTSTTISYSLAERSTVTLSIVDMLGREVTRINDNEMKEVGSQRNVFHASRLPSGMYICKLITSGKTFTKTMLVTK